MRVTELLQSLREMSGQWVRVRVRVKALMIPEHAAAPVAGAGGANGDVDCCSAGVARPGGVHSAAAAGGLRVGCAAGSTSARGRWGAAAVAGKRTSGVDIGDGDRGPGRAAIAAAPLAAIPAGAAAAAATTTTAAVLGSVALVAAAVFAVEPRSLAVADCSCSLGRRLDPANATNEASSQS